MDNESLKTTYEKVYKNGSAEFFTFDDYNLSKLTIEILPSWKGLDVLEIGCGEGKLATMVACLGARLVDALDYSNEAINMANNRFNLENLNFHCVDYRAFTSKGKKYDVVILQGVLEHFDKPFEELQNIIDKFLKTEGYLLTSSPSFLNPRGYIWMTLQLLFDVPMSLSDLHFLCPFDFEDFCKKHRYKIEYKSTDQDWGSGKRTITDFRKRLKNALKDANMDNSKVNRLLSWLERAVEYHVPTDFSGASIIYKIWR